MEQLVECVPNFSAGRSLVVADGIVDCFRCREGVKLLDYTSDNDHNRLVVTVIGRPEAVKEAVLAAIGKAVESIDLNHHEGVHPRLGAADVVPFIPFHNMSLQAVAALARSVGEAAATRYNLPIYLYEAAATAPHRCNLADVRKGDFEGLATKMQDPLWLPDFGPARPHPTAGATIIGARDFLVAFNINLQTDRLDIAKAIAKTIRASSGGLPFCKALGLSLPSQGMVQVSINLTNIHETPLHRIYEAVCREAQRHGVVVARSELIGLVPLQVLVDTTAHCLQLPDLTPQRVLEYAFWE